MNEMYPYLAQQLADPAPEPKPNGESAKSPFDQWGLLMMGGVFVLMYFFLIRPQRKEEKRKKTMLAALQKGDPVVTSSGIIGTVASIKPDSVLVNVGDNTRIEFLRSSINQIRQAAKTK